MANTTTSWRIIVVYGSGEYYYFVADYRRLREWRILLLRGGLSSFTGVANTTTSWRIIVVYGSGEYYYFVADYRRLREWRILLLRGGLSSFTGVANTTTSWRIIVVYVSGEYYYFVADYRRLREWRILLLRGGLSTYMPVVHANIPWRIDFRHMWCGKSYYFWANFRRMEEWRKQLLLGEFSMNSHRNRILKKIMLWRKKNPHRYIISFRMRVMTCLYFCLAINLKPWGTRQSTKIVDEVWILIRNLAIKRLLQQLSCI